MKPTKMVCKKCVMKTQREKYFPRKMFTTSMKLEIVHTNLSGPTKTRGFYDERYFMILVDDFTRTMWVAFLKEKSEAFEKFKVLKNRFENESGMKVKYLRSDRGGEFTLNAFNSFCEADGIKRKLTTPITPEKNGILERRNRSVVEATRAMMLENDVSKIFWREAENTTLCTMNRVQIKKDTNKTPYELWFGHKPLIKYFRIF